MRKSAAKLCLPAISLAFLGLWGCRTTSEFNPYVSIEDFETVVIEDFDGPDTTGYEFAERLARALSKNGLFTDILRHEEDGQWLRIQGSILRYEKGNPAMKLRYGRTVGNARFNVKVDILDGETGDFIGTMTVAERFETVGPTAPRFQDIDKLVERAAGKVANALKAAIEEGP